MQIRRSGRFTFLAESESEASRLPRRCLSPDVKHVWLENQQKMSKNDTTTTRIVPTLSDTSQQIRLSGKSALLEKPKSEACPLSVSPHRCPSPLVSSTREKASLTEQAISKSVEDDDEAKWHKERRVQSLPIRSLDDAIILPVTCGSRQAELVLDRLETGSRGACIRQENGLWLTPNEFQLISGRGNAKDWKRSIRHHGHSLKSLTEQELLSLASPPLCICEYCDVQVSVL